MSRATLVVTVTAEDRPGVVEAVAAAVAGCGGNWEESRMARLGGRFAGILLVGVDPGKVGALQAALRDLEGSGIRALIERTDEPSAPAGWRRVRLELVGQDRIGIIRDISRALAGRGVNVEDLTSACEEAPMAGGELFRLSAALACPPSVSVEDLKDVLEAIAHDLMVDLSLREG
jgi:glycine cleavage system regulatory protein